MSESQFGRATGKIFIRSLDDGTTVTAQFNPKELQIDRQVPWSPPGDAAKKNAKEGKAKKSGGIDLEFTGAKGRSLTVELLFDNYEQHAGDGFKNEKLMKSVSDLEHLATVIDAGSDKEDLRRPHWCVAEWGGALQGFRCVIESLSTKYTMFAGDGTPLRAICTVKLQEADSVSAKKKGE